MAYINAHGHSINWSAKARTWLKPTNKSEVVTGKSGAEALEGSGKYAVTLRGNGGDDTYYPVSGRTTIIEDAGGGNDSVKAYFSYLLPANVENLQVLGSNLYAFGNELDNIIKGGKGSQTLDGRAGDDVLIGGSGADIFIIAKGEGSDLIHDFTPGLDQVRFSGVSFDSFAGLKAAMQQVGKDAVLNLGDDDVLVFKNVAVDDLEAGDFLLPVAAEGRVPLFNEEFDDLSLFTGSSGTWKTSYYYGDRTLSGNGERQLYVDAGYKGLGIDPFSIKDGILSITAERASAQTKAVTGLDFTSGLLTSEQTFSIQYGVFEMRAQLPAGKGLWPAFWLLPADGNWPPELDIMEVLGGTPEILHTTVHSQASGSHTSISSVTAGADLSAGFHTYGVDWQKDQITWYLDGVKVSSAPTPDDMHGPMYMLANLAVGGWAGKPSDRLTHAEMQIDYIRAYQKAPEHPAAEMPQHWQSFGKEQFATLDGSNAKQSWNWSYRLGATERGVKLVGDWARYAHGNDLDNFIQGSNAPYNELAGGGGNDVLRGGGGVDVFIVRDGDGNDTVLDFSNRPGNSDKLELDGFHFEHFDDVLAWSFQDGADTLIRLDEDQALLLKNVSLHDLSAEQFVFMNSTDAPRAGSGSPENVSAATVPPLAAAATAAADGGLFSQPDGEQAAATQLLDLVQQLTFADGALIA
ncbi:family 16 glycosylhydrolase [Croceicoccus sp. F390]|uniref:Family 16 glycosylhydrolase n=1 Tax=Croceicoccus esteveae TaxID=3075597 RepID=A0ABU2ZL03_9SPHN|nr:family 16 glycosylhydrolase [Croceicoccus sp. F390]MDT0577009.1 family 16 glycosylhydrolase [Croceicoccus sp. F390]